MNYKNACSILDIDVDNISGAAISAVDAQRYVQKQYRRKALLYHPDKNPHPDSCAKFQEVRDAYEYLSKYQGFAESDSDDDDCDGSDGAGMANKTGYNWTVFSFLKNVLSKDNRQQIFYTILQKVTTSCEATALDTLRKLDKPILLKTRDFLKKYMEELHFTEAFMEKIDGLIVEKLRGDERILLNPTLTDLMEHNLYKLHIQDFTYIVPLWHHELVYDNSGNDIYVKCCPVLPDNTSIDDKNNIRVSVAFSIPDVWGKETVEVVVGDKPFAIRVGLLKLCENQTVIFAQQGVSRINTANVYDVTVKSDVIFDIRLEL